MTSPFSSGLGAPPRNPFSPEFREWVEQVHEAMDAWREMEHVFARLKLLILDEEIGEDGGNTLEPFIVGLSGQIADNRWTYFVRHALDEGDGILIPDPDAGIVQALNFAEYTNTATMVQGQDITADPTVTYTVHPIHPGRPVWCRNVSTDRENPSYWFDVQNVVVPVCV